MLKMIMQPEGSNLCGQACVAMLLGISLDESIKLIGKRGKTRTRDLVTALKAKGCDCGTRLIRGDFIGDCIIKMTFTRTHSHWIIFYEGKFYDPSNGFNPPGILIFAKRGEYKLSSYLPIYSLPAKKIKHHA